ncbi:hypothetical protein EBR96_05275, partial [bacterium]|nr:hypothetical protein [bacterium]
MLISLRIQNLAVIESCEIDFRRGFTVLTGETGAGKSIIIDAISLLMGQPAGEDMIRAGKETALVEGIFNIEPLPIELEEFKNDDGTIIIQRRITQGRPSVGRINGQTVPIKTLRHLTKTLIGITGQHDQLSLFETDAQRQIVDRFASSANAEFLHWVQRYQNGYIQLLDLTSRRNRLRQSDADLAQKIDFLKFQIDDISQHQLQMEEDDTLTQQKRDLTHRQTLETHLNTALLQLDQLLDMSGQYAATLQKLIPLLPVSSEFAMTLPEMDVRLTDQRNILGDHLRTFSTLDSLDIDAIEARLDVLFKLKVKYKEQTVEGLLSRLDKLQSELKHLENAEESGANLDREIGEVTQLLTEWATAIHDERVRAAHRISAKVESKLKELGFSGAQFNIQFHRTELGENGLDA